MIRISLAVCVALVAACKSKSTNERPPATTSEGSATAVTTTPPTGPVPALRWIDPDGELLLASGDGHTLEAACGVTGTITATEVEVGGVKQPWATIIRKDRTFSLPRLDWVIEVSPSGEVTHTRAAEKTSLGTVTGLESESALPWFGAFVVGAALVQHTLALESPDATTKLVLQGAADLKSWEVKSGAVRAVAKNRDDPEPVFGGKAAFDPGKLTVTRAAPGTYTVSAVRDDDAMRAAFPADTLTVIEDAQGALGWRVAEGKPVRPLARLTGRKACRAHDEAVGALIWAFLGSDAGATQLAAPARAAK